MKAIGYIRVSTTGQAEEGVSLDAQREKIAQWAAFNGAELAAVFADEGISGKRADNRPALQEALDEVEAIAARGERATLIVYSLSRLARSTRDTLGIAERIERCGADLASISERIDTGGATGKMVFRLLAVLAEFERDLVAERTSTALRHKRGKGEKTGGHAPIGYSSVIDNEGEAPRLIDNPAERATIQRIEAMRDQGKGYHTIARTLESEGVPTKAGGRWAAMTVRRVYLREQAARAA